MKKDNKGLIILIIVLAVLALALGGYIYYNNFISDEILCIGPLCPNL